MALGSMVQFWALCSILQFLLYSCEFTPTSQNMQVGRFFALNWPEVWVLSHCAQCSQDRLQIDCKPQHDKLIIEDEWMNDTGSGNCSYRIWLYILLCDFLRGETPHTCAHIYQGDLWSTSITLLWSLCPLFFVPLNFLSYLVYPRYPS